MTLRKIILILCIFPLLAYSHRTNSQTTQNPAPYNLKVAVDEVGLTFHATDAHGLPVNDLKLNELRLLDNDKPPRRVLVFQSLLDLPIRAGILMDTSQSMEQNRPAAQRLLPSHRPPASRSRVKH